ncbi:hypothetical protein THAOC_11692, partial [Thalassiosira oceanica]
ASFDFRRSADAVCSVLMGPIGRRWDGRRDGGPPGSDRQDEHLHHDARGTGNRKGGIVTGAPTLVLLGECHYRLDSEVRP